MEGMSETTLYYIAMIVIYSGLLPWIVGLFTRSKTHERDAARKSVDETLGLVERVRTARAAATDPVRQQSYDAMIARLLREANDQISELNALADQQSDRPARRYLIIPTPRSAFGVVLTVVFAGAAYFAMMFLLTIAFDFWNDPSFDVINNAEHRQRTLFLAGGAAGLALLAFLVRFLAYRSFDSTTERLRREAEAAARSAVGA